MGDTHTIAITRATDADTDVIARVLARAFEGDPVFRWIVPDPDRRRWRFPPLFAAVADVFLTHEETYVAGEGIAVALWAPPGKEPIPREHAETFEQKVADILEEDAERAGQVQELMNERHPAEPAFYLQFMGVMPHEQGKGVGSRLMADMLQRCDSNSTPAYLEATSLASRRLYERHGFEVVGEIAIPEGPSLWPMWRHPRGNSPRDQ